MELHEYYVKQILKKAGLPLLKGNVAYTPEEARDIAQKIGGDAFWIKPQVMTSGSPYSYEDLKEKYLAHSVQEVEQKSAQIFGSALFHIKPDSSSVVQRIYVEQVLDESELFSIVLRVDFERIGITFAIKNAQDEILSISFDHFELEKSAKKQIEKQLNLRSYILKKNFWILIEKAIHLFKKYELMAIELSPVIQKNNDLIIVNSRLIFDPDSLFRFPEIVQCREIKLGHEREALAKKNSFRYTNMSGNVACLVNGIGLGWATIDLLKKYNKCPACLLDLGTTPSVKSISTAMKLALAEPNVDAIFVNIFGGTIDCEVIAKGLLEAAVEIPMGIPVIIRLAGLNAENAEKMLKKSIVHFVITHKMNLAVKELVSLLKEKK